MALHSGIVIYINLIFFKSAILIILFRRAGLNPTVLYGGVMSACQFVEGSFGFGLLDFGVDFKYFAFAKTFQAFASNPFDSNINHKSPTNCANPTPTPS